MLYEKLKFRKTQHLLVVPHNILAQWQKYISDFSDNLSVGVLAYYGDITGLNYDANPLFAYDILITTASFYELICSTVRSIGFYFNRVVLDEIDSITYPTMTTIPASNIWLVSASANQTRSGEYAQFVKQNVVVCDPLFIKRSVNLAPPKITGHICGNEYVDFIRQAKMFPDGLMKFIDALDYTAFKFPYLKNNTTITSAKCLLFSKFINDCVHLIELRESLGRIERGAKVQKYLPGELAKKLATKSQLETSIKNILRVLKDKKCAMCCDDLSAGTERRRFV